MLSAPPPGPDPSPVLGVLLWCLILAVALAVGVVEREGGRPPEAREDDRDEWIR